MGSLDLFRGIEPTYARALVEGLEDAVKQDMQVEWGPVLGYLGWIAEQPPALPGETESNLGQDPPRWGYLDRDLDWGWTRRAAGGLLYFAFEKDAIDWSLREDAWDVVDRVAWDSEPAPQGDERSLVDPEVLSMGTTCGYALHAVMQYALWVYRNTEENIRPGGLGMGCIPEVRERLERDIDPVVESPAAVRAVLGRWFPWLVLLDRSWTEAKIEEIFSDNRPVLRDAAWETYLESCRPPCNESFVLLRGQYSAAADRLARDVGGNLVQGSHGSPGGASRRTPSHHGRPGEALLDRRRQAPPAVLRERPGRRRRARDGVCGRLAQR